MKQLIALLTIAAAAESLTCQKTVCTTDKNTCLLRILNSTNLVETCERDCAGNISVDSCGLVPDSRGKLRDIATLRSLNCVEIVPKQ